LVVAANLPKVITIISRTELRPAEPRCGGRKNAMPPIRWHAVAYYRTTEGTVDVHHDLEELYELHDLVELGPHWDTIERIEVARVNHCTDENLTVEQSKKL
jgi:hypothetical protein